MEHQTVEIRLALIAIATVIGLNLFHGWNSPSIQNDVVTAPEPRPPSQTRSRTPRPKLPKTMVARDITAETAKIKYRWVNHNSKGDIRRSSVYATEVHIDLKRLGSIMESYGLPVSVLAFDYRTNEDRIEKLEARVPQLLNRGFVYDSTTHKFRVDYDWVVEHSHRDFTKLASNLRTEATLRGHKTYRELVELMASFIQTMKYKLPKPIQQRPSGISVHTGGFNMPLQSLFDGWGDCDTKSLLFASIMANYRRSKVILLYDSKHLFLGVHMSPRPKDHFVRVQGIPYVLAEMTTPWMFGDIPDLNWRDVRRGRYYVVALN